MAEQGTSYRPPKATRMWLERLERLEKHPRDIEDLRASLRELAGGEIRDWREADINDELSAS